MSNAMLRRACMRLAKRDGRDPDRWQDYISSEQRSRVFTEIDAERNFGLFLCAIAMIAVLFGPAIVEALR